MQKPLTFPLNKTALAGAVAFLLVFAPSSTQADEPVALTPVAELPEKPDVDALAEELRTLEPAERRERLRQLRKKYGAREERRATAPRAVETDPRARLKRPFPDRAAYTNALAQARDPAGRKIDPVMLMEMQQQQLNARIRQFKSLGTNAPVELEAKIEELEDLNRRLDERLKVLKAKSPERESGAATEESEDGTPGNGEPDRAKGEGSAEEEKSEK